MITVIAKIPVKEGKTDEFIEMFKELTSQVAKEEGTKIYKLCRDKKKPNVMVVMEAYKDQDALKFHSSTPHFQAFFGKAAPLIDGQTEISIMEEITSI